MSTTERGRAVLWVAALCAAILGGAILLRPRPARVAPSGWHEGAAGFATAVAAQRETNAPLLVYFRTDWCGYCKRFERDLLPAAPVRQHLDGVIKVRLNPERDPEERAIADRYGVRGFPSLFMESGGARTPVRPFERVAEGWNGLTPERFVAALRAAESR